MPKNPDLTSIVRGLVAHAVAEQLEPYRLVLERVSALMAIKVQRRGGAKAGARRAGAKDEAKLAARFEVGQVVTYKQGRGAFEAKVLEIAGGVLSLERASDGKKVSRPASKVSAAQPKVTPEAKSKAAPEAKPAAAKSKKPRGKSASPRKAGKIAFQVGQTVTYKQGRGAFEAVVKAVDPEKGTVTLERAKDGRKLTRPAAKVTPVAVAA